MKLPIDVVQRMASPLKINGFEILPNKFLYRFIVKGKPMDVTKSRFFKRLSFEGRHSDTVEFAKTNGKKIICDLEIT